MKGDTACPASGRQPRGLPRILDAAFALAALALLAPAFALIALLIAVEDGRPIFFRQKRIGRHGAPFLIRKFRTMRVGSRGPPITARRDPRVTRVGAWLRAFKLDELPQLMDVLEGTMSLIGPRPEVPEYVRSNDELWSRILESRPGITDLASLVFRDEESILAAAADGRGNTRRSDRSHGPHSDGGLSRGGRKS